MYTPTTAPEGLRRLWCRADGTVRPACVTAVFVGALGSALAGWAMLWWWVPGVLPAPGWALLFGAVLASYAAGRVARVGPTESGWGWPGWSAVLLGALVGAGLVAASVVAAWMRGAICLQGSVGTWPGLLLSLGSLVPGSLAEELSLRGFLLAHLRRWLGGAWAVLLTAAAFGLVHLGNPSASALAVANVMLVGLLFGILALRTGSVWVPAAAHVAWNVTQGPLLGQPVSGWTMGGSVLRRTCAPAELSRWSGGDFGPEAAWSTAALLVLGLGVAVAWRPRRSSLTAGPRR